MCVLGLSIAFYYQKLDGAFWKKELLQQPEHRHVAAVGLQFFFLAFIRALREGSRFQELSRAWWSPGAPRPGFGLLPPSWDSVSGLHSIWQGSGSRSGPHELCDLGQVPQHSEPLFSHLQNGADNPPAVLTGQDSVCLKQALAGPCPQGAPGSGSEILLPRLCARMPGPPPWASALRCQAGGNLWQGWQQPHAHGLVLGPGSVLCIGPIHLLQRSGHQHPSYGRGN